jgi:choline dehydrogenase-like flavoprotein
MNFPSRRDVYDVVIVGSGAGGGMAAYELTKAGATVLLLEAGGMWDNTKDSDMLMSPWETARRGGSSPDRPFGEHDACIGGWNVPGEPFTTAPGTNFSWWRARMVGGRTNHWGRISLRFGPDDFQHKSIDGLGDNWPITYNDIAPYYDEVDELIGIFGSREGMRNHPDGKFLPPPKPRCWEMPIKKAADKHGVTCIPSRLSILTRPINNRAACHYCGQCNRGCKTNSNFSSTNVLIAPALLTGKLTMRTDAMVREVSIGKDGLADGVVFIDKVSGEEQKASAKVVVLAASACETARIMLNSKSAKFPQGLGNSSGMVGKYLTDTTGTDVSGFLPTLVDQPRHNCDGVGGAHLYMPWWLDNKKLDFPRGYHIEIWGGMGMPGYGVGGGTQNRGRGGGYGAGFKQDVRSYWGTGVGFSGRGEMIPNEKSFCELDPRAVDRWGIPVLRFHWEWSDHEFNQVKHMQETFRTLLKEMGAEVRSTMPTKEQGYGIATGGSIIHELGCVRMGSDSSTSVLNEHCQAWDCKNLFVADGGPFVSQADKNPTWTILALSMRTSRYIASQRKGGKL